MSSDIPETKEENLMVECPSCDKNLSFPLNYFGKMRCPICKQVLIVGTKENIEVIEIKDRNYWLGFVAPISPIFILATIGFASSELDALIGFTCSLFLWPVIGFSIAKSRGTFVKSFRAGASTSAVIGLIFGGLLGLWIFSWLGDALR